MPSLLFELFRTRGRLQGHVECVLTKMTSNTLMQHTNEHPIQYKHTARIPIIIKYTVRIYVENV